MALGVLELLVLVVLGGGALVAVLVTLLVSVGRRTPAPLTSEVAAARRHAVTTSVLAGVLTVGAPVVLLVGMTAVVVLGIAGVSFEVPALALACAPLLGTFACTTVLLVGELTWPRPRGTSRTALLRDRSVRSLLGHGWMRCAAVATVLTVAALVTGGLLGAEGGQRMMRSGDDFSRSAGPFPGWGYAVPQLAALAACLVVAAFTLRAVASRSAVVTADAQTDDLLRTASAARVGRALTAGALVTLGADLFFGGSAAGRVYDTGAWHTVAVVALATGPVLLVVGLVTLLLPVPRLADLAVDPAPPAPPLPSVHA